MKESDKLKKIVPFKKDIIFKTNIVEITSISLEHSLHLEDKSLISGEFIISGEYKMTDTSVDTDKFSFNLPFDINIDEKYKLDNMTVDIDDFYYELVNNNILSVNIDVLIDKLEEKINTQVVEEKINTQVIEEKTLIQDDLLIEKVDRQDNKEVIDVEEPIKKEREDITEIFNSEIKEENYLTYKVYIVREDDTVESIIKKYNINHDKLMEYNDLTEVKTGDKLIIPQTNEMG